ncbi:hypothetical protein TRIATDRAFT_39771 [Trichoderma atroviride IMI 206040]|uniref:Uncharacterized protein n=1 Tax=Hypocrea atroviridis (strain ATCC 20476 / IMI 206040) TaxID=452589 RepID=G9NUY6_HYPAI|nr:uncharacterized protein TRIATDRAFT_39771 [Trichoderma atroviride IMI 206040]EHK44810.1 hypothetical protein TRIATDRAFT_39771 [Trichoderma atroviride IMI 206040]
METNHELHDLEAPPPPEQHLERLLGDREEDQEPPLNSDQRSTSELAPPQPEKTPTARVSPRQRARSKLHSIAWKVEFLAWIASTCCFIALIITLKVFDGHPLPDLKFGISPGAIIQLLSAIGEFFLEISFGSGLGQLKWLNALQKTPLADFHTIDEASRGAWGSVVLIAKRRGGLLASLGAFIVIVALGIGTFVQQALDYDTIYPASGSGSALMPIARFMNGVGSAPIANGGTTDGVDSVLTSAPYLAFYSPPGTNFTATAHCSTGNCTWSSYQTLGVCNTCKNLTSQLKRKKLRIIPDNLKDEAYTTDTYTLPNGFGLTGIQPGAMDNQVDFYFRNGILNVSTTSTPEEWDSVAFSNNGSIMLDILAVAAAPGTIPEQPDQTKTEDKMTGSLYAAPVAYECMLQFCVRTMNATFVNGTLHETVVSTWTNETQGIVPDNGHYIFRPPNSSDEFRVLGETKDSMVPWLNYLLVGSAYSSTLDTLTSASSSDLMRIVHTAMNTSETGFQDLMDNFANSMSLSLRSAAYQPAPTHGDAFSPVSHAVVTWEWLILPAFELIASLVFLVLVTLRTRKAGLIPWTNNILAVFYHGFDQRPSMSGVDDSESALEEESHGLLVQFQPREEGGRLAIVNGP